MDSPGLMVLMGRLAVHLPGDAPGPEWASIECASKEAYGCGVLGERLLKGLALYVRRLGYSDLNSELSISLTSVALRSIQEDLGIPAEFQGRKGCLPEIHVSMKIANREALVLLAIFRRLDHAKLVYYLVYDAQDTSLHMIPYIRRDLEALFTLTPVPARPAGGGQGHELALFARKFWPQRAERDRLCVCTPSTRAKAKTASWDSTGDPWAIKVHPFPNLAQAFSADVMFSFEDKVFWADLSQGIAYVNLRKDDLAVFIRLPPGYQIDFSTLSTDAQIEPANMSRTMGFVEGSIKFICIIRSVAHPGNEIVKVWTLDLDHKLWKEDKGFPCLWKDFWKQACHMNAELRYEEPLEPQYPIVMPDGALCLLLSNTRIRICVEQADYLCSFDMANKRCLCFGRVSNYQSIGTLILPCDFFVNCYPAPTKRKLPMKRKVASIVTKAPMRRPASVKVVSARRENQFAGLHLSSEGREV